MGRFNTLQSSFSLGEVSPKMLGRSDLKDQYVQMCQQVQNYVVQKQGGATRRSGSQYQFSSINGIPLPTNGKIRIIPFTVSKSQTYLVLIFPNDLGINSIGMAVYDVANASMVGTFTAYGSGGGIRDMRSISSTGPGNSASTLYPTFTGMTSSNTAQDFLNIDYAQSGDVMVICGTEQCPIFLTYGGYGFNNIGWNLFDLWGSKNIIPLTQQINYTGNVVNGNSNLYTQHGNGIHSPPPFAPWELTPWTLDQVSPAATIAITGAGYATPGSTLVNFTPQAGQNPGFAYNLGDLIRMDAGGTTGIGIVDSLSGGSGGLPTITVFKAFGVQTQQVPQKSMWTYYGWPKTVCFFQQRLVFGGSKGFIDTLWGSLQGNICYFTIQRMLEDANFATVSNDRPFQFTIAQAELNEIRWLSADRELMIGTSGGEWLASGTDGNQSLGPLNIGLQLQTAFGSERVKALRSDAACQFVQRGGQKVREIVYDFRENYRLANDITNYAEHIVRKGVDSRVLFQVPQIIQSAYQPNKNNISWFIDSNGCLFGCTRDRSSGTLAWHWHPLGGASDPSTFSSFLVATTQSNSVTPGDYFTFYDGSGNGHYIWYQVNGVGSDPALGGGLTPHKLTLGAVDSSTTVATTLATLLKTISGISSYQVFFNGGLAGQCVITNKVAGPNIAPTTTVASGHFTLFSIVTGVTYPNAEIPVVQSICCMPSVRGDSDDLWMAVTRKVNGIPVCFVEKIGNASNFDVMLNSSTSIDDKLVLADASVLQILGAPGNTFNGFTHIPNTLVDIIADGNYIPNVTVDGTGTITIPGPTTYTECVAGLPFNSLLRPMPIVAGSIMGSADGTPKRIDRAVIRFFQTVAASFGKTDDASLVPIEFRDQSVPNGTPTPMFTGVKLVYYQDDIENDADMLIKCAVSLPCTITSIAFRGNTYEG